MYTKFDGKTDTLTASLREDKNDWSFQWEEKRGGFYLAYGGEEVIGMKINNFWETYCPPLMTNVGIWDEVKWFKSINLPEKFSRYIIEVVSARLQIKKAEERGLD